MLQELEDQIVQSLQADLGYHYDARVVMPLQVADLPAQSYPLVTLEWGEEVDESATGEDVPLGYYQSDIELVLRVVLYVGDAELRPAANAERLRLKKWAAEMLQFAPSVVEFYYKRSSIGRLNPDSRPAGGLEFVLGLRYRQSFRNPEKC